MKQLFILLAFLAPAAGMQAQTAGTDIDAVLRQIETNNKEIQASAHTIEAQKLALKAENNLPDPTLSYSHLWDSDDKNITVGELVISQGLEFPTLYTTRAKLNRQRFTALDAQAATTRQQILLQAKEVCLDIIFLNRQQALLDERLRNAEELSAVYQQRLKQGDANALETNKINLELLNVRTEARTNRTALEAKLQELRQLNGGEALVMQELTEYPAEEAVLPADFPALCNELLAADPTLQALENEHAAARRQLSLNKQGWLPNLEIGYRRNTETRHPLNGIVVGFSFPIFQNRGKVRTARTEVQSIDFRRDGARIQAAGALRQLYDEASTLSKSIDEYRQAFAHQQDLTLLRRALDAGQISMIEYFVEVSVLYQSRGNLLQLENQYHKALARMYKSRL